MNESLGESESEDEFAVPEDYEPEDYDDYHQQEFGQAIQHQFSMYPKEKMKDGQHTKMVISSLFAKYDIMGVGRVFPEVITFEEDGIKRTAKVISRQRHFEASPWVIVKGFTGSSAE